VTVSRGPQGSAVILFGIVLDAPKPRYRCLLRTRLSLSKEGARHLLGEAARKERPEGAGIEGLQESARQFLNEAAAERVVHATVMCRSLPVRNMHTCRYACIHYMHA